MKTWLCRFTAKQLGSMHADHLGFIIASSHCCNELLALSPYLIFEQDSEKANEVEKSFIDVRFFTIVRMQIAKIFEYRDLCNGYVRRIRKTFPSTAEKVAERSRSILGRLIPLVGRKQFAIRSLFTSMRPTQ
jgi:type IV secretory pathway TraG/TraD family ATPase VirD4